MRDRTIVGWGMFLLLVTSLACNAFAGRPDSSLPPPPIPTDPPINATIPVQPGLAPTATLPSDTEPVDVQGTVRILVDLNIRSGPGVRFDRVGFLLEGARATVIGQDTQSGWWRIVCPSDAQGSQCWVSGGSQYTLFESNE